MHGPRTRARVAAAYAAAGITDPPAGSIAIANITGHALDVIAVPDRRDSAIDALVYRWDLKRPTAARYLDLAVEALTANPQE